MFQPVSYKERCRRLTDQLIEFGAIQRKPCFYCGNGNAQCNHKDYGKPWKVNFLCDDCHKVWHTANGDMYFVPRVDYFVLRVAVRLEAIAILICRLVKRLVGFKHQTPQVPASENPIWQKLEELQKNLIRRK